MHNIKIYEHYSKETSNEYVVCTLNRTTLTTSDLSIVQATFPNLDIQQIKCKKLILFSHVCESGLESFRFLVWFSLSYINLQVQPVDTTKRFQSCGFDQKISCAFLRQFGNPSSQCWQQWHRLVTEWYTCWILLPCSHFLVETGSRSETGSVSQGLEFRPFCGYGGDDTCTAAPAVWLWQLLLLPSLSSRISSILRVVDSTDAYEMVVAMFATASLLYAAKKVSWRPRRMILEHRIFWEAEEDETEEEEDVELWVGVRRWARKARRNIKKAALETGFSFQSCQLRGGRWWKTLRVAWTVSLNLWFIPVLQLLMSGISQATVEKALSFWGEGRKDLRYVCFATISEALSLDR